MDILICFDTNIWLNTLIKINGNVRDKKLLDDIRLHKSTYEKRRQAAIRNYFLYDALGFPLSMYYDEVDLAIDLKNLMRINIILPETVKLELLEKLFSWKTEDYLIASGKASSGDLRNLEFKKKLIFETQISKNQINEINSIFAQVSSLTKATKNNKIVDFGRIEELVRRKIEFRDAMIIVEADSLKADYFITNDSVVRRIKKIKPFWLKTKIVSSNEMLSIIDNKSRG